MTVRWHKTIDVLLIAAAFGVAIAISFGIGHQVKPVGAHHAPYQKARPGDPS
jgi:hypothetical protein